MLHTPTCSADVEKDDHREADHVTTSTARRFSAVTFVAAVSDVANLHIDIRESWTPLTFDAYDF